MASSASWLAWDMLQTEPVRRLEGVYCEGGDGVGEEWDLLDETYGKIQERELGKGLEQRDVVAAWREKVQQRREVLPEDELADLKTLEVECMGGVLVRRNVRKCRQINLRR